MTEGWLRLHALEEQATDWLAAHPDTADTTALFDAFMNILSRRHADAFDLSMPINEATIEMFICLSRGRDSMPLPLPDSRADCACAELTGALVDNLFLSGSARENSCVSLLGTDASDVDIMLQLGAVTLLEMVEPPDCAPSTATAGDVEAQAAGGRKASGARSREAGTADSRGTTAGRSFDPAKTDSRNKKTGSGIGDATGEIRGQNGDAVNRQEPRAGGGQEGGAVGGQAGIVVIQERTSQPGFVLLQHPRLPSCLHPGRLPFSAQRVVHLMDSFRESITTRPPSFSGPSVSTTVQDFSHNPRNIDLVACLPYPNWPNKDYASRPRPSGQPSAALVARLCRTPAFLVPVGFPGSATETLEWRLSFSRQEYIAYRSMTKEQRMCLTALKYCKAIVGEAAKPLKSYFLKTALLWLVESRSADQWTLETMHESLLLILRYLDVCLRRRYLPCYFWPEVNLLASRSAAERTELSAAVAALRQRLLPAVMALLTDWLGQPLPELARRLLLHGDRLTAEEFWSWTMTSAVCQTLARKAQPQAASSDGKTTPTSSVDHTQPQAASNDDSDSDDDDASMSVLFNLLTYGRNQTAGSFVTNHPFFSGLTLGVDVFEMMGEREDFNPLWFLSMLQRGSRIPVDSWFEEN